MQEELDQFTRWCNSWKLVLNKEKCESLTITGRMKVGMDAPDLKILGHPVKKVETMRYLGLYLDKHFNFKEHLFKVEMRLAARLNSLYSLTANYDINTNTLLNIYKTQVRPIWEYGCMFYANTKEKVKRLQVMQNKFLRLTFPTAKSSSIDILHIVANIEMVENRVMKYRVKLLNNFILSPSYHPLFQLRAQLYNQLVRPTKKYTYSLKGPISSTIVEVANSELHYGAATDFVWNLPCNLSLTVRENTKQEVSHPLYSRVTGIRQRRSLQLHTHRVVPNPPKEPNFLGNFVCEDDDGHIIYGTHPRTALPNNWDEKIEGFSFSPLDEEEKKPEAATSLTTVIYTDGSMEKMYAGAGACIQRGGKRKHSLGRSLFRPANILEAELDAIEMVLEHVLNYSIYQNHRVIIYSDCQVAIRLIGFEYYPKFYATQLVVFRIRNLIRKLLRSKKVAMVELNKVKAHVGIEGNEEADQTANKYKDEAYWDPAKCKQWSHNTATSFLKDKLKRRWKEEYSETCRHKCQRQGSTFFHFVKEPTQKFTKLFSLISRREAHIMMRIMCDRLPLRNFMHKMGAVGDTTCQLCNRYENSVHFIFQCGSVRKQRRAMISRIRRRWLRFVEHNHFTAKVMLYGYFHKPRRREITEEVQLMLWRELCQFITETDRFTDLFGGRVKQKER